EVQLLANLGDYEEGGWLTDNTASVVSSVFPSVDSNGRWEIDLTPNEDISPAGTLYLVRERYSPGNKVNHFLIEVPQEGATPTDLWAGDLLILQPRGVDRLIAASFISYMGQDLESYLTDLNITEAFEEFITEYDFSALLEEDY